MAIIKCKMCGGDMELSEDKTFGVCEYCGSTMTLPKVDGEQTAAAFNRGNHFRRIGEFDKALAIYEHIVEEDDKNAEAHWCCALCRFGIEYVEDPDTHDYIPTCHRASFDSILEDVDYLAALEHSDGVTRKQYEKDGAKIDQVQKGVLAVSQKEEPFDVFLCYKETEETGERTRDSVLAQEIYYELTEQGRRVFFARVTLENKGGAEYEPYIFAALHSAKVMVVLGTKAEHFGGTWVKNEWSRFLAMMKQDRSKLLIPCYRDMDPYDLPDQLSPLQAYDMGKIGFLQDLTHGINKVLDAGKEKEEAPKETVVVQSESGNLSALLQRGELALEDGEWERADEFFEQALNLDADEPRAYLGKFLAQQEEPSLESLVRSRELVLLPGSGVMEDAFPEDQDTIEHTIFQYSIDSYCPPDMIRNAFTFNRKYQNDTSRWESLYQKEASFWEGNKLFQRALEFSQGEFRETLRQAHDRPLAAIRQKQEEDRKQDEAEKEKIFQAYREHMEKVKKDAAQWNREAREQQAKDYETACKLEETSASDTQLREAKEIFLRLGDYQDSPAHAQACEERLRALQEAAAAQLRQEQEKLRIRNIRISIGVIAGIVLALGIYLLATKVIIPENRYSAAETLLEEGKYQEAIDAFAELGDYKDSIKRKGDATYAKNLAEATVKKEKKYAEADAFFQEGRLEAALEAFEELGDYQDAEERADLLKKEREKALNANIPVPKSIFAGACNVAGIKSDGTIVAAGTSLILEEKRSGIAALSGYLAHWDNIQQLSIADDHVVGLTSAGTVVAEGSNGYLQCDVGKWENMVAVAAGRSYTIGLKQDGTVSAKGINSYEQCNVGSWKGVVQIATSDYHTVGLRWDGTVVATGFADTGQCCVEDWTDIVAVSAGQYHTVGLKSDGTVVSTEYICTDEDLKEYNRGQCAITDWKNIIAISANTSCTIGLKSDGTVVAAGDNSYGQCNVSEWTDIVEICTGYFQTFGLKADGSVAVTDDLSEYDFLDLSQAGDWTNIKLPK